MSESGYPGLKDEQDETRAFITNYLLPITHYHAITTIFNANLLKINYGYDRKILKKSRGSLTMSYNQDKVITIKLL
ncbi:MAG: hypothetical protein HEQ20_24260 [Aphanizomenon flos-aquae KM1D3_PB]|uniref:hypothetical protein n=1 Tax=Aphanizomenon flos-aquae TaxID=1176 RepID=UPI000541F7DE|nr:hypothetical protein [Aphanizomenon flos-aquae]KHG40110.1 hypothetical protein OA07_19525 [Aphanizomenon flos-aquae 2012/KM1/D3]QSV73306.1 MAG: hypothetical protein HEQ20_24260 [Aphanizomenon flos-aquae KM1D3_PB]